MRGKKVEDVKSSVTRTGRKIDDLLKKLSAFEDREGRAFDISVPIPGTDSSVSDIRARHAAVAGLVKKLDDSGTATVPLSFFSAVENSLRSTSNAVDQIVAEIDNFDSWQGLRSVDYGNFQTSAVNGNVRDLGSPFKTLFDSSESFLSSFHNLFQAVNPSRAHFNFSSATNALSQIITRASKTRNELSDALSGARKVAAELETKNATLTSLLDQAQTQAGSISEQLGRSGEAMGQIESNRDRTSEIAQSAQDLETTVIGFAEQFKDFETKLTEREQRYEDGINRIDTVLDEFTQQKEFINAIISQSDNMLSGATVAGLSSEFRNIRDDLTEQLNKSHTAFNWSIAFLAVSALPLILFIFAPIIAPMVSSDQNLISAIASAGSEKSGWQYVGQVIARFIILLPAIWFVTFTTARYNSLFKLREHYAYKYSMAVAVDGFKKQAPGHEELVAALVFEQLAFNPADKLGRAAKDDSDKPSPAADLLIRYLRKRLVKDELEE